MIHSAHHCVDHTITTVNPTHCDVSTEIGIQFGLDKCRNLNMVRRLIQLVEYDTKSSQNVEVVKQARRMDLLSMKIELFSKQSKAGITNKAQ